jgi:hypothetical protein
MQYLHRRNIFDVELSLRGGILHRQIRANALASEKEHLFKKKTTSFTVDSPQKYTIFFTSNTVPTLSKKICMEIFFDLKWLCSIWPGCPAVYPAIFSNRIRYPTGLNPASQIRYPNKFSIPASHRFPLPIRNVT